MLCRQAAHTLRPTDCKDNKYLGIKKNFCGKNFGGELRRGFVAGQGDT